MFVCKRCGKEYSKCDDLSDIVYKTDFCSVDCMAKSMRIETDDRSIEDIVCDIYDKIDLQYEVLDEDDGYPD
jgi:hypothetical protein